jgi:hypothetical protein
MAAIRVTVQGPTKEHPAFRRAFEEQVLCAPWMVAEMLKRAEAGAAYARSIAPVRTGAYRDSIQASAGIRPLIGAGGWTNGAANLGGYSRRAEGQVSAGTDHAAVIEFGDGDAERHRVLGRSMDAMGAG